MEPDYRNFLRALSGEAGEASLFEPFVPVYLTEQLIWRRGEHLWDTPEMYLDTLLSLRERTYADVVCADMRRFGDDHAVMMAAEMARLATEKVRFVALCGSAVQLRAAETSAGVCAVGIYNWKEWYSGSCSLPSIAMDGDCEGAVDFGFAGWFCPADGEMYWAHYHGRITILGGLGVQWLEQAQPVEIQNRCQALFDTTENAGYIVGSGGEVSKEEYLSLISLLGIYRKQR